MTDFESQAVVKLKGDLLLRIGFCLLIIVIIFVKCYFL